MQTRLISLMIVILSMSHGVGLAEMMIFEDCSDKWNLAPLLQGIMAHAAACGDIDGDGDLDLYIGNFCDRPPEKYLGRSGPTPNMLLIKQNGQFKNTYQSQVEFQARTSGAVFVDLDNDGDLDLYVSNNSKTKGLRMANKLFENRNGQFQEVPEKSDACVIMGGRSVGVLDYNGDGLLDLLVAEDSWTGERSRLLRNAGGFRFEDVSAKVGLPIDLPGLGVITPDLNEDGWPDIFISQINRLFLSKGDTTYKPADSRVFQYEPINNEATPCGVAFGDLNLDGHMDIVIVDHSQPARQHLYLNLGLQNGIPQFKECTVQAGLDYLFPSWTPEKVHLKHAHVEIADFDNDGWPDIFVAATYRDGNRTLPFICRNITYQRANGKKTKTIIPLFAVPPVEKADAYFSAGPVADYDRDGRLDIFLASWFPQIPSKLFLNRNLSNHWLRVKVVGKTFNRMGIGTKVKIYDADGLGEPDKLIGYQQIGTGYGFCSGQEAVASFGLGERTVCDVEVVLPYGKGVLKKTKIKADQLFIVKE